LAGGAKVELKVAGPHAAQRRVFAGFRASGLLEVHASAGGWRWSAVVGPKRGAQSRVAVHAAQPNRLNGRLRLCRWVSTPRCLGPLRAVLAPLEAGERVSMGAAAAFSAWPPALRELVAYLSSVLACLFRQAAS